MTLRSLLVMVPLAASLCGCSFSSLTDIDNFIYRSDVHQGNLITEEMLAELGEGMSQSQVRFLLGEPLIKSQLHENRWDYAYYCSPRKGETVKRSLTIWFDNNGLVYKYRADEMPNELQADASILGISIK